MNYPDVFFTPEYHRIFATTEFGGEPRVFSAAGIEYRFYVRPIEGIDYFDIVSPYGYSGPVEAGEKVSWASYLDEFSVYCRENRIVAEFARLHPFLMQPLTASRQGEVVYVDLEKPFDFDKGCKSAIKKAEANSVIVDMNPDIRSFVDLYWATMKRNNADLSYYFNLRFFIDLMKLPWAQMSSARINGKMVAGIIILVYDNYAHYLLAGSDREYLNLGVNNLLLSTAMLYTKGKDCKVFNLGGGKDESHLSFKRSFSNLSLPFYVYEKVHNQEVYDKLCRDKGIDPNTEGFFPAYRREN